MKIGITASTFDLFHAGHVLMLEQAKQSCDYLIAAIQTDPTIDRSDSKNSPIQSLTERQIQVTGCKYVDETIVYTTEEDLIEIFTSLNLDVRIIGIEYKNKKFTGKEICKKRGIKIVYNTRDHDYSTTNLRNKIKEA